MNGVPQLSLAPPAPRTPRERCAEALASYYASFDRPWLLTGAESALRSRALSLRGGRPGSPSSGPDDPLGAAADAALESVGYALALCGPAAGGQRRWAPAAPAGEGRFDAGLAEDRAAWAMASYLSGLPARILTGAEAAIAGAASLAPPAPGAPSPAWCLAAALDAGAAALEATGRATPEIAPRTASPRRLAALRKADSDPDLAHNGFAPSPERRSPEKTSPPMSPLSGSPRAGGLTGDTAVHGDPDGISDAARRYCLCLPPRHPRVWSFYKLQESLFWTAEEVDLSKDKAHWAELSADERHFVKTVLAFFASSDGIVGENLTRFVSEVGHIKEAVFAYSFQFAMENVHSEMYSLLIDTYISDAAEKKRLFNAILEVPCVKRKAEWALSWSASGRTLAERILAFACVEGIHFSSSFCAIFWLKKRGLMPGLTFSNELISRDEGMHTDLACAVLDLLCARGEAAKPPQAVAERIFREAVSIEAEYCRDGLPVDLLGMNSELMIEYVEYVADRLLVQLGYERAFGRTRCVFDWMEDMSLAQKTNFFENRVSDYVRAAAGRTADENCYSLVIDDDADV